MFVFNSECLNYPQFFSSDTIYLLKYRANFVTN